VHRKKNMGLRRLWLHFKIAIAIKREFAFSLFSKFPEPQQTLLSVTGIYLPQFYKIKSWPIFQKTLVESTFELFTKPQ
jgi:hypothetical protein